MYDLYMSVSKQRPNNNNNKATLLEAIRHILGLLWLPPHIPGFIHSHQPPDTIDNGQSMVTNYHIWLFAVVKQFLLSRGLKKSVHNRPCSFAVRNMKLLFTNTELHPCRVFTVTNCFLIREK